jgi:hypothetical protein
VAFTAGQKLRVSDLSGTAGGGGGGVVASNTVIMSGDVTVNNTTTFTDATGLSVAVLASATYRWDAWLMYTGTATPDFKITPSSPTGATGYWSLSGYGRDVSPAIDVGAGAQFFVADVGTSLTVAGTTAGTERIACRATGYFTTSTTAGTFRLRMGQRSATVSNTVLRAGSWMDVVRIS